MDKNQTMAQTAQQSRINGPLHGVRILDLTGVVFGPIATQALVDMGADVVKIEGLTGDRMRANGVSVHRGMSSIYLALNRNKRSLAIDLKKPAGQQLLKRLIPSFDVFVHNMRVPAIERLGLGYEQVRALHPNVIYCAATGFGQSGPDNERPAFDDIIQAASGLTWLNSAGGKEPDYVPSLIADKTAGLVLANAMLGALLCRERTGIGQYVEVPMFETLVSFVLAEHLGGLTFVGGDKPAGYQRILAGGRRPARTADGFVAMLPYTEKHWKAFFAFVGREDLAAKYNMADRHERNARIAELYADMHSMTPLRTTAEWVERCRELDIPCTPINSVADLLEHEHVKAVGLFEQRTHPTEGTIRSVRPTANFSETPLRIRRDAPALGADSSALLREAGLEDEEVAELIAQDVVRQG